MTIKIDKFCTIAFLSKQIINFRKDIYAYILSTCKKTKGFVDCYREKNNKILQLLVLFLNEANYLRYFTTTYEN